MLLRCRWPLPAAYLAFSNLFRQEEARNAFKPHQTIHVGGQIGRLRGCEVLLLMNEFKQGRRNNQHALDWLLGGGHNPDCPRFNIRILDQCDGLGKFPNAHPRPDLPPLNLNYDEIRELWWWFCNLEKQPQVRPLWSLQHTIPLSEYPLVYVVRVCMWWWYVYHSIIHIPKSQQLQRIYAVMHSRSCVVKCNILFNV